MKRAIVRVAASIAIAIGALSSAVQAETLSPERAATISAATFEVVAAKPVDDPLTYEKPLPFEALPYQERNDKYYSIGTAFSIGGNRYVTAGHVLMAVLGGLWGEPALRASDGRVYAIDKIEKFSLERDFAVFSLAAGAESAPLGINTEPSLNTTVYTVGNALGTGVVVRDGLYTSNTPEDDEGRWNFMRFSAAASPGNSGGPLLDGGGRIIGVVLRKSPNENLNYALPIAEVLKAPDHVAEVDSRMSLKTDLFDSAQIGTFKAEFSLPLGVADFTRAYRERADAFIASLQKALLAKEADRLFPNGTGAQRLLHAPALLRAYPALLSRNDDGIWAQHANPTKVELSGNGYIEIGTVARDLMVHWHRPDASSAREAYGNPDAFLHDLLATGFMSRQVGTEKIKITALGKPVEDDIHTDRWGRRWQARVWPLPHGNMVFIAYALPVPDGYAMIGRVAQATDRFDHQNEVRLLTDYVSLAYEGTLRQWKDFLALSSLLPRSFSDVKVDFTAGGRFDYVSDRLAFSVRQEVQPVAEENLLTLGMAFYEDRGKVVWDVGDVRLKRTRTDNDWINVERYVKSSEEQSEADKTMWNKVSHQLHPFDGVSRTENDVSKITAVVPGQAGEASGALYTVFVGVTGVVPQERLKEKMDALLKDCQVKETWQGAQKATGNPG